MPIDDQEGLPDDDEFGNVPLKYRPTPEHRERMAEGRRKAAERRAARAPDINSAAFQEAVAKAAAKAVAEAFAQMAPQPMVPRSEPGAPTLERTEPDGSVSQLGADNATNLMQSLALEIARISDQGTGRKRVAPKAQADMDAARARMEAQIEEARLAGEMPHYELTGQQYLEERLIDPTYIDEFHRTRTTCIGWPGVPNEAMRPINEPAFKIFGAFIQSIGGSTAPIPQTVRNRLDVLHEQGDPHRQAPETGATRLREEAGMHVARTGVSILRGPQGGDMVDVRVLGTVAPPARQLA